MLGTVILLFVIANVAIIVPYGLLDLDSITTMVGLICLAPLLLLFIWIRRPKLTHVLLATPDPNGRMTHPITNARMLSTPMPTRFSHHLIRDSPPLEMPPTSTLWIVFAITVTVSFVGLLPMLFFDEPIVYIIALLIGIPAWLFGFSLPVHAWWAFSTRYLKLTTTKYEGERMLVAGMLSTIPAIFINSILFPLLLLLVGIESMDPGTLGEFLILAVSAPVGEEICKALLILTLARMIDSPRRGFQVGFSVGLGFAMLENLQYILVSLSNEGAAITYTMTAIVRGVGSIPGHAFWTGLSGTAIGWWLCTRRGVYMPNEYDRDSTWQIFDPETGRLISSEQTLTKMSARVQRWLEKPYDRCWSLPKSPAVGIGLGIIGHSIWNGSSWLVGMLFVDFSIGVQIFAMLCWVAVLIGSLWWIGREILAAVKHLPA